MTFVLEPQEKKELEQKNGTCFEQTKKVSMSIN